MDATKHNAVWCNKQGAAEITVWADGGCIYRERPVEPTLEVATYEPTEWDGERETAWQIVEGGKVVGTLRFES